MDIRVRRLRFSEYYNRKPCCSSSLKNGMQRTILKQQFHPRPVVFATGPNLKESAALSAVAALWHQAIADAEQPCCKDYQNDNGPCPHCSDLTTLVENVHKLMDALPLPKSMYDYIAKFVKKEPMLNEIKLWVKHHEFLTKDDNGISYLYLYIPHFHWSPCGEINYKITAANLLTSTRCSLVDKYKLACMYCLEDNIEKLFLMLVADGDTFLQKDDFFSQPLTSYWSCYFRLELPRLLGKLSMDNFMFQHRFVSNWWAKEYFFNRLTSEEKVENAVLLIDKFDFGFQKLVLSKLNKSELTEVYIQRAVKIMLSYLSTSVPSEEILSTWSDVSQFLEPDQFVLIFYDLLLSQCCDDILTKIWASANDEFKNDAIAILGSDFMINKILHRHMNNMDCNDGELLFAILSDVDNSTKKRMFDGPFFRIYCDTLVQKHELATFERLIKQRFPKNEKLENFKLDFVQHSTGVRNECLKFYLTGEMKSVNRFLTKLLPSHPHQVQQYKEKLLMSPDTMEEIANNFKSTFSLLDEILEDGLPTEGLRAHYKKCYHSEIVDRILRLLMKDNNDREFLFSVLSNIDFDIKQSKTMTPLFRKCCEKLIQKDKLSMFEQLVRECMKVDSRILTQIRLSKQRFSRVKRCLNVMLSEQRFSQIER